MRLTTDEKGYVTGWSIAGDEEGILCQAPADFDRFAVFYPAYQLENGKLTEDSEALAALQEQHRKEEIRRQREERCFPYINRGNLWYERLSREQLDGLKAWYQAWLDAPETLEIPSSLSWLEEENQEV